MKLWIATGAGIGTLFGALNGNPAIGIALGVILGAALGYTRPLHPRKRRKGPASADIPIPPAVAASWDRFREAARRSTTSWRAPAP
jgi:hypothetical protein